MSSMRQAITVKYHGPTTRRDARLSTTTASGIRRYWPRHSLPDDTESAYMRAAGSMQRFMQDGARGGWEGRLQGGWTGEGVAVFTLPEEGDAPPNPPAREYVALLPEDKGCPVCGGDSGNRLYRYPHGLFCSDRCAYREDGE